MNNRRSRHGIAIVGLLALMAPEAAWSARPIQRDPDSMAAETREAGGANLPGFSLPSFSELLLAQAEDDGARARRRRRPTFQRPGGGRGEDAGRPEESSPPRQPAPTPPVEPTAEPDQGSSGERVAPVTPAPPPDAGAPTPSPDAVTPSPDGVTPSPDGVTPAPDGVTPAPEAVTPAPRRPVPTRPGQDSSGAPEPRARRQRPSRIQAPTYENELPDYEFVAVPDRWRIVENLGVNERWYDPYNQNTLKADRPIPGTDDWFVNLSFVYDGIMELRRVPTPTGVAGDRGSEVDLFGDGSQWVTAHTFLASVAVIQGDTTFRPPDWEFRVTAAANVNYAQVNQFGVLKLDPTEGDDRLDYHFSLQEAFVDKHLWNRTDRFDFDSLRIGIQPFNADFRGFLFQSQEPGVRLFGNLYNNRAQYNLAWFGRLNKDTNSGLNNLESWRDDHTVIANFYYQDFPVLGFNVEAIFAANINREGDERDFDNNKLLVIPQNFGLPGAGDYEAYYIGIGGDGHIERVNMTFQLYGLLGESDYNSIAQQSVDLESFFAAIELSYDIDWMRYKAFFLYSMGDDDPFDDKGQGFDTILDNPNFAGGTTSFWQRQQIACVFCGGGALTSQNSIVPSLRTSKLEGQSNFVNPGLWQVGAGADFDILPQLRLLTNVSWLQFDTVQPLEVLRQQARISREIGWDISAGLIYRPFFTNNVIFRASGAVLIPGSGYEELFDERSDEPPYSVLLNLTLTY
jgi:hypothetical protein